MGLFNDLADAFKKRLADPPQYRTDRSQCHNCRGSGICTICGGDLEKAQRWFSKCDCAKYGTAGKCLTCKGSGYVETQVRIGGTSIFEAVQQTSKASRLVDEFATTATADPAVLESKINQALALNPDHIGANVIKGILHYKRGDMLPAIQCLEKAEKRAPKDIPIKQALCFVYEQMGNQVAAEQKFLQIVALGVKVSNRNAMNSNLAAGAAGGIAAGLIAAFLPSLNE